MDQFKTCNECLENKSLTDFTPSKTGRLGVVAKCKPCKAKIQAEYLENNREHVNKQRQERTSYKETKREKDRAYWAKNKDQRNKRRREDRKNNPEKYRQWDLNNRDLHYMHNTARRALKKGLPTGLLPSNFKEELIKFYGDSCMNPECPYDLDSWNILTHDHVIPITHDGSSHTWWNSQILCRKCNASKGSRNCTDYRNGRILLAVL